MFVIFHVYFYRKIIFEYQLTLLHKKRVNNTSRFSSAVRWCSFKSVWWRWCSVTGLGESVCSWWWCRVHSSTQFGYTTTIIVLRWTSKSWFKLGLESDLHISWSVDWEIVQSKPRRLRDKRKLKKLQGSSSNARVIERQRKTCRFINPAQRSKPRILLNLLHRIRLTRRRSAGAKSWCSQILRKPIKEQVELLQRFKQAQLDLQSSRFHAFAMCYRNRIEFK